MLWRRASYWLLPAAWAAGIFVLSSLTFPQRPHVFPHQDKVVHALLYAVLSLLLFRAFTGERRWGLRKAALAAFLLASFYGITDEFHQYFTPMRSVELADWLADTLGAAVVFFSSRMPRRNDG